MSEIPPSVRKAVLVRDNMQCQRCGCPGSDIHHRQRRRDGGHGMGNLILLCRDCHSWAHGYHPLAIDAGFIIKASFRQPAKVPVMLWSGQWAVFSDEGGVDFVYDVEQGGLGTGPRRVAPPI